MSKTSKPSDKLAGTNAKKSKGKTPEELMHTHIQDKDHVISDEEFKNLSITTDNIKLKKDDILPKGSKRPKDEDKDPAIVTPWNVISE